MRTALLLAVVVLASAVCAVPARAEGPTALERLSPEQRTYIEQNIEGWADLSPERQERIAANVLRLTALSPDEQARLKRRIETLERHREGHDGRRPPRFGDPHMRDRWQKRGRVLKAVGDVFWNDLPEETRATIEQGMGRRGREAVGMSALRNLWEHVAQAKAAAGIPVVEVDEDTPPDLAARIASWVEQAEAGDTKARQRLAHAAVAQEMHRFGKSVDGSTDDVLRAAGRRLVDRHPEAFDAVQAEIVKIAGDPEALRAYARRGRPGRRGSEGQGGSRRQGSPADRARRLLQALRDAEPFWSGEPTLEGPARRLLEALEKRLGAEASPGGRRGPRHGGPRPPGGSGGRGPRGPGRGEPRPGGGDGDPTPRDG